MEVEAEQLQNPQQRARQQPPMKAQQLAAVAAAHQQQQQQQAASPKAQGAKQPAKGKQLAAKGQQQAASEKGEGQEGEGRRRRRGAQSLTALTALGTVALYGSVRGGISLFHHARRKFLTQVGAAGWLRGDGRAGLAAWACTACTRMSILQLEVSENTIARAATPQPAAAPCPVLLLPSCCMIWRRR